MRKSIIGITDPHSERLRTMPVRQANTIEEYAVERMLPVGDSGDQAWAELKTLLAQRIADGLAGKVSSKGGAAIVDEELAEACRV